MILTGVQFVGVTVLVKILGTRIPSPEAAFLRYVLGLIFLLPLIRSLWLERLPRDIWGLFA
ncbi:MAG: EamA family transporter, partial [Pseudomonadota bacterium]